MTRFLVSVWPWPGHYFPLIAIAHQLRAHGHEVAFYTGGTLRETIEGEGFTHFPFCNVDEAHLSALVDTRDTFASIRHPLKTRRFMQYWLLGTLPGQIADLAELIDDWRPDVVVAETAMWGPVVVLHETKRIPVAVFSTVAACLLPGPDAPPFGIGLSRGKHGRTRVMEQVVRGAQHVLALSVLRRVNRLRRSYGLASLKTPVSAYCGQMALYVMPSVPEFDYQRHDLPRSVHYVGPCIWNKPHYESAPAWLSDLSPEQPVVHVSEGTVNSQQPLLLRTTAQALANLPMQVIMTTGGNRCPETLDLGPIAPNVNVVRWVAHSDLLPLTNVLVTTGGAGTVMAALQAGVPLVVVPTEWDKSENAERVVEAGVGLRLNPRQCTPHRLRAVVEQVLHEPKYRRNAQRMRVICAQYAGSARAAELLEHVIDN